MQEASDAMPKHKYRYVRAFYLESGIGACERKYKRRGHNSPGKERQLVIFYIKRADAATNFCFVYLAFS